jgi:tetratricopeptide (TPR) repeat protein
MLETQESSMFFRKSRNKDGGSTSIPADDRLERAQSLTQNGEYAAAAAILESLVASHPRLSIGWYKLGNAQKALNRTEAALASYQRAIDLDPSYGAALCNRGAVLMAVGRVREALISFERATQADPADPIARFNLAQAQIALNERSAALESLNETLALNPDHFDAYLSRAWLHDEQERSDAALADLDRACSLRPQMSIGFFRRANTLAKLKRWIEALRDYDTTMQLEPAHYAALLNRANVFRELGRFEDALRDIDRALEIDTSQADPHFNRGLVLEQLSRVPEALASFERVVAIRPDWGPGQHSRALALMLLGKLESGFAAYEWRWKNRATTLDPRDYRGSEIPLWDGAQSLQGRRILVFSEQGLGDTLQFSRYIPLLAANGAHVIFEVQPRLLELMQSWPGAGAVISTDSPLPPVDFKCPLMSLPYRLGTTLDTIPSTTRYLTADPERVRRWQQQLADSKRPRIGLTWSGNPNQPEDRYRSVPLAQLIQALPPEFEYFCLQREIRPADRAALEANPQIHYVDADFPDTAALCECLDLVVSSCTSIAHLAGALGRPVWLLISSNADWRWFLDRADTPWYPTARLYRQSRLGDWSQPLAALARDIRVKFAKDALQ